MVHAKATVSFRKRRCNTTQHITSQEQFPQSSHRCSVRTFAERERERGWRGKESSENRLVSGAVLVRTCFRVAHVAQCFSTSAVEPAKPVAAAIDAAGRHTTVDNKHLTHHHRSLPNFRRHADPSNSFTAHPNQINPHPPTRISTSTPSTPPLVPAGSATTSSATHQPNAVFLLLCYYWC